MKTIALSLFAAALACAQGTSTSTTPAASPVPKTTPKTTAKTAASAQKSGVPNKKPSQPAPPKKAVAQPPVQTVPAGAKQVEPNLYRYTDSNGKSWYYRQTPFGISKSEDTPASAPQPNPQPIPEPAAVKADPIVVTDLGDSYRFERKTPFGASTWVRKKSELSDAEKALAADQNTASDPNRNVNSKPAGNQ
jgi:hypothetical protein